MAKVDPIEVPIELVIADNDIDEQIVDAVAKRVFDKLTAPHQLRPANSGRIVLSNDLITQIITLFGITGTVYRVVIDATINEAIDVIVYHRGTDDILKINLGDPQGINLTNVG